MPRGGAGFDAEAHEKHHWWRSLLLRFVVCLAVSLPLWWFAGWTGGLVTLMLWAKVFAGDLYALGEIIGRALKQLAFRPVQGRFYQFKGHRIRVLDDDIERQRWIALADLATALGAAMPAASIRRRRPEALREERDGIYVLDATALAWLKEQRNDRAGRLALWVEREVWYPVRGRKASYADHQKRAAEAAPSEDREGSA
jgi:hypothetical protein